MLKTWGWMMAPWGNTPTPRGAAAIAQGAYCAPTKLKDTPVAASKAADILRLSSMCGFVFSSHGFVLVLR